MDRNKDISQVASTVHRVLGAESDAIRQQLNILDMNVVDKLVALFSECTGKILVTGCGTSGAAAKKIAHSFCCINRPSAYLSPADARHGGAGLICEQDIVVILSKGGATPELVELAQIARAKGAVTVAVSEKERSSLTQECDLWLQVKVDSESDAFNMLATASTLSVISVMDAIIICVMEKTGFSREEFAVIHPGGAVGERLSRCQETEGRKPQAS